MPYAHPEALVSTEWLAAHLERPACPRSRLLVQAARRHADRARGLRCRPHPRRGLLRHRRCRRAGHQPAAHDPLAPSALPKRWPSAASAMTTGSSSTTRTACPRPGARGGCCGCSATTMSRCSTAACRNGRPRAGRSRPRRRPSRSGDSPPRFDPGAGARQGGGARQHRRARREQVVDARAAGRFDGSAEETWPGRRRGHIPGSRNLPFDQVTDPKTKQLKKRRGAGGAVRRRRRHARPPDRDQLRLGGDRLRAGLRAASDRARAARRSMTGRGRNGACPTARRSRPGRRPLSADAR